jgi:hypothetical protein
MVFFRRIIVSTGGVDFGFETPQVNSFVLEPDFGSPFVHTFIKKDPDIYRGGFCFNFTPVMYVLRMSGEAEVGPAIIERIAVFVVNKKAFGRLHNFSVQVHIFYPSEFCFSEDTSGIQTIIVTATGGPFETAEAVIDIDVNDGPIAVTEVNFTEGAAEAEKAIGEQGTGEKKVEPVWNFDLNGCHFISSFF